MLRLHFEPEDRGRVVFDLAWHSETIGSLQAVRQPGRGPFLDRWAQTMRRKAHGPLLEAVPADGYVPDLFTPEELSALPTDRVVARVRTAGRNRELLPFGDALLAYQQACIAPALPTIGALLRAELAHRAHLIFTAGLDAALATLGPGISWEPPVLAVSSPADGDVLLNGRGLRLVPSVFWPRPGVSVAGYRRPTVSYPIHPAPASPPRPRDDPLAALVGATRAEVLRALTTGCGTTQLARRLEISPATASAHVTALREAGLAATRRTGKAVHHTLTPLGLQLLGARGGGSWTRVDG
ncbi:helix-turn-helix domain-containing protein [Actinoplanes sp. CA-030573]|uniref:ArsR/SmtB family transcription factor n=1 Tax=Actinoplanes sp. CA-030573 TaxID=3239898 RepID=UPI003D8DC54C